MDLDEVDELLEGEEWVIINDINPEQHPYTIRPQPNHMEIWDDNEFFNRFRLSKATVTMILGLIEQQIRHPTDRNFALQPMNQLLMALRFYACGSLYVVVGDFGGVHKTTCGRVINKVTNAIAQLRREYIKLPENLEQKSIVKQRFYEIARFPRVIGALDCTHIRLQSPGGQNAENFRNRKGWFSINTQALCTADYKISDIVARWPGSCHDSQIFNNSQLRRKFEVGEMGNDIILADSGYPLRHYLLTPFPTPIGAAQNLYNESHIRTRGIIERTFGIWKRRFPILSVGMRCRLPLVQNIIVATAVLHNIARMNNELDFDEPAQEVAEDAEIDNIERINQNDFVRNELVEYFQTLL